MKGEIYNAIIKDTFLGVEDHCCFTFMLYCEFSCMRCAFGGRSMGFSNGGEYGSYEHTSELLCRVMDTIGVSGWEDIKGKLIRVKLNDKSEGIEAIGHILDNKWFNIKEFFDSKNAN